MNNKDAFAVMLVELGGFKEAVGIMSCAKTEDIETDEFITALAVLNIEFGGDAPEFKRGFIYGILSTLVLVARDKPASYLIPMAALDIARKGFDPVTGNKVEA